MNLRTLARDQTCTVRLPGICRTDHGVVLAHLRRASTAGMALKPVDLCAVMACSACHEAIGDGHTPDGWRYEPPFADLVLDALLRTLVRVAESVESCEHCGKDFAPRGDQRFCSSRCRSAWHREHSPRGTIRSVRHLANGGRSVVVHFPAEDGGVADRFDIKQEVFVGGT